ncbi:hypothetical protein WJX72_009508 [[Myrmecia] bisecta]|uniref:Nuclear/nucleolar GTPase 2 n=1 Tax=[Myrmecia] bisecta TaxID=41462 RepID=A0AAW1PKH3_9CHLO
MGKARTSFEDKRQPKHGLDGNRPSKGAKNMRDAATVRRLNMYKKKAVRDKKGKVIHEEFQSKELPNSRIQPDRRWFGNTRVIGQKQLEQFRDEMSTKVNDAYTVLLREKKLPMSLLEDPEKKQAGKAARVNLLQTQPYAETFAAKRQRKRPKLAVDSYQDLLHKAEQVNTAYDEKVDASLLDDTAGATKDRAFEKGQSKRIWGELYKVVDSSDVVVQVLDARDPIGTRCKSLEQHLRKNARHKHMLLLLNKCDLVPAWVTKRWLGYLSKEYPTLAFHASITNPFGKGSLLSLLRQLARLRSDKKYISVGFVGYPNVGKSSVINTLRSRKVCKAAPIPGETRVWQFVTLMRKIFLIDCPGVVHNATEDSPTDSVLKGVIRVENLEDATEHISALLERVKPEYLRRAYKLKEWTDAEDFLTQLARAAGKLVKGGDPDLNTAAKMMLYDWQRGKIPFFTLPPDYEERAPAAAVEAGGAAQPEPLAVPSEAVTAEDTAHEAAGLPGQAIAAAEAVVSNVLGAAARQRKQAIPVQQDYFIPEDERGDGEAASDFEDVDGSDVVSDVDSEAEAEEDEEDEDVEAEAVSGSEASEAEEDAFEEEAAEPRGRKRRQSAASQPAADDDDGAESDGYGDAGLSWEAVMQSIQGEDEAEAAVEEATAALGPEDDAGPTADRPAKRRKGEKKPVVLKTHVHKRKGKGKGGGGMAGQGSSQRAAAGQSQPQQSREAGRKRRRQP